ncbi:MAG: error-prone DNA polymerase, partial [Micromonosporaceae bacterium]|nr:error-prone DNA polymerase [Micromonosporaceae bacterium]
VVGAELSLRPPGVPATASSGPRTGRPDPPETHLLVLAQGRQGYSRLARTIGDAHLRGGRKGQPAYDLEELAATLGDQALILTGCRKGHVPRALLRDGAEAAARELDRLVALFGADRVAVELTSHGDPGDDERNDALAELAAAARLPTVATGNVHYATPGRGRLASVLAAIRARRTIDDFDGWLPPFGGAYLRSGAEMARRFAAYPGAVARTTAYAAELAFDLDLVAPGLPTFVGTGGVAEAQLLRDLTLQGAARRYGQPTDHPAAYAQIAHELEVIEKLGFSGYFLVVHDIVLFCHHRDIYCQGRGSAANSAVCYALGITNVDAVRWGLLFERFLSPERDGPPDIDVDIESGRREEVVQYVFERYGRRHAAQVANVITYRPRSAVRDLARVFGYSRVQRDTWSKRIDRWGGSIGRATPEQDETGQGADPDGIPEAVVTYATAVQDFPRHLGIHSGGMVICDRPLIEICPVEHARMPGRTVLQWDKDDCAAAGLVKFDLLGLGMLSALHRAFDLIDDELDLAAMPLDDPEVYEMLCRADAVGVFQVESRAQLATLPRLRPREFYDLVIEVALIRPGPIQGDSVHPYLRRRAGQEPVTYPHPALRPALARTLGVPLFQEQLMRIAIDVAGFTPAEADELRQAMGAKRSRGRMVRVRERLYAGMAANQITGRLADELFARLAAFANYGFPESHAISFAYLVYASAWMKRYHPAAFCAALLNSQPMGFYAPQALVDDARRHGVLVRRPDVNLSLAGASLEPAVVPGGPSNGPGQPPGTWGTGGPVIRLGLAGVRGISTQLAERVVAERAAGGRYVSIADLAVRVGLTAAQLEALATADGFASVGLSRRAALWAAGAAAGQTAGMLPGTTPGLRAPMLPGMDRFDRMTADVWAMGFAPDTHPMAFAREYLDRIGALPIARLAGSEPGRRIFVGGVVTHRQRPATAGGITFLNLEDETGMLNVVCSPGLTRRYRAVARTASAMVVRGMLERSEGVTNLKADQLLPLFLRWPIAQKPVGDVDTVSS